MHDVFCYQCGHRNVPDANFCSSCGAALVGHHGDLTLTLHDDAMPDVTVHIDDFGDGPGVLVIKRGGEAGTSFVLASPITLIGRLPSCEIFLDDVTVSRIHAEVGQSAEGYVIRDRGSLNGTYVNRESVTERLLASGDEVQIGKFRLVFLVDTGE